MVGRGFPPFVFMRTSRKMMGWRGGIFRNALWYFVGVVGKVCNDIMVRKVMCLVGMTVRRSLCLWRA